MIVKSHINFDLQWFLSNCHTYTYPYKSILIYQGETAKNLLYIIKGGVLVFIKDNEGKLITIYNLKKGDFFGEESLFKNIKRKYWVQASKDCKVAEISYKNFYRLIKVNMNLLIHIFRQISQRLQKLIYAERYGNLDFFNKLGEVSKILLKLVQHPQAKIRTNGIKIKISSKEISRILGYSIEDVSNILKIIEEKKLINIINDKNILVYDTYQ